jgi:hypothetical protein
MAPQLAMRRILLTVGGVAIVLTLVGVYGVTAQMVGLRTCEMGVRLAVGDRPGEAWLCVPAARRPPSCLARRSGDAGHR